MYGNKNAEKIEEQAGFVILPVMFVAVVIWSVFSNSIDSPNLCLNDKYAGVPECVSYLQALQDEEGRQDAEGYEDPEQRQENHNETLSSRHGRDTARCFLAASR